MIPLQVPPLTGLSVLVTRPAQQASELCTRINALGGDAVLLPVLEIVPRVAASSEQAHELLVFISVNAVKHGLHVLQSQFELATLAGFTPHIAAVGAATAALLAEHGYRADITPLTQASSEGLLEHESLQTPPATVLIVRGQGGRELLRDTLTARGCTVTVAEVYERLPASPAAEQLNAVLALLRSTELDIITVTSIDILQALDALLSPADQVLAHRVSLLAGSARIAAQAKQFGWQGECVVSSSPEDKALLGSLVRWRTRARN
jgi:uroporphyrinogen-III synthase